MVHAKRDEVFTVGDHSFDAAEVCSSGKFRGNTWNGPPRAHLRGKFERWASHLERGVAVRGDGTRRLVNITVQTDGGFQNAYVFAEHDATSAKLWAGIAARRGRMPAAPEAPGTGWAT